MTTPSPTTPPTLRTDWGQTAAGCLRTDDYWIWEYNGGKMDARTVLGGPSQTTNCFESSWDATVTFAGSGCPPQYTSACGDAEAGAVTCCPSAYDFSCQAETWTPGYNHAEWFRCMSKNGNRNVVIVTKTDMRQNTLVVQTRTRAPNEHLFALAVMYSAPPSTGPQPPTDPSPTTPSPIPPPDPSTTSPPPPEKPASRLSPGAAAGIGVSIAAIIILLGVIAWLLYRRRKSNGTPQFSSPAAHSVAPAGYKYTAEELHGLSPPAGHSPNPSQYSTKPLVVAPELSAEEVPRFELDGTSSIHH